MAENNKEPENSDEKNTESESPEKIIEEKPETEEKQIEAQNNAKNDTEKETEEIPASEDVKVEPQTDAVESGVDDIEENPAEKSQTLIPIVSNVSETTQKKLDKSFLKEHRKAKKEVVKEIKKKETSEKLDKNIRKILHDQFHGILDEEKVIYTIVFFLGAIIISLFSLFGNTQTWPLTATEATTTIFFLGFLILMILAMIPLFKKHMFGPIKEWRKKLIIMGISFGIAAVLTYLFMDATGSTFPIYFLRHSVLLPVIFIIVFIGWNVIQIHFIKEGLEQVSMNTELKYFQKAKNQTKRVYYSKIFLVIALATPFILHIITSAIFNIEFKDVGDPAVYNTFLAWAILMGILLFTTDYWQLSLYRKSMENQTPNIFSSMFFILLQIIFWFRSFGFINSFRSATKTGSDIFIIIGNVFLLAFTSIMVLRGLAERVKKSRLLSEDSMPFLVYAFTILYVAGQVAMILNGLQTRDQVNIMNNALTLVASLVYYFWYSNYILQRKGYVQRNLLTLPEVSAMVDDLMTTIVQENPGVKSDLNELKIRVMNKHKFKYTIGEPEKDKKS